ncbi:MAG: glycosyltransferase family 39 protein [Oscillatoriales cyanobacterium SM2_2_1]|nr:glycosyltransferase family 39 protein [Oscillatoriales cyanobacterium SM2_2_1]
MAIAGPTYDGAAWVNGLWMVLLMAGLYGWGHCCFDARTGWWAAALSLVVPLLAQHRLDFLLDYPLTVAVVYSYWFCQAWCDRLRGYGADRPGEAWLAWGWAVAMGLSWAVVLLTRTSGLLFLAPPLLWLVGGIGWGLLRHGRRRTSWLRLLQGLTALLVTWLGIGGWFSQNWLTIISTTLESTQHGVTLRGDPQANTLAGWLYYPQVLPEMLSPLLVLLGLAVWSALHFNPSRPQRQNESWRWLWFLAIAIYVLGSLGANKQPRLLMPWLLPWLVMIARGLVLVPGSGGTALRWGAFGAAALLVTGHLFPVGLPTYGSTRYPDRTAPYPHNELIDAIATTDPHLRRTLGVLVNTAQLNPMNLDFAGAARNFQVYARQLGFRPDDAIPDGRSLSWYVTKTGDQGEYATIEAGQQSLRQFIDTSPDLPHCPSLAPSRW